jgi:hypothetical protein
METLLKCTQPALAIASDHLIELVDRVIERHPHKGKFRFRRKLFSWLRRDLVRPSLNRPSQKIYPEEVGMVPPSLTSRTLQIIKDVGPLAVHP